MSFLEQLREHYNQTKLAILEGVSDQIASEYPELKNAMEIKRNRLEINSNLSCCYIDMDNGLFKICIDGQTPYCYEDLESVLVDIGEQIAANE
ncbi:hypothetical protein E6A47_00170 [Brachyspira pilosicoli]|uniref:hypothetical protein n=1 Tax=Brachyspira pilosicoli TaxID=52584 RepID=UPI001CA54577|nr:hypothetical protein [Brachyspira pilosicoli]MBW5398466.1 hypothetical protein [Brachyspira pilosicoli]